MALRYLFVDMNSYFASVEQQERPALRDRPTAVIPMDTDSTCCIAASYEAKAYGVTTGTGAREAKRLCPSIRFAVARPKVYVQYHHRIIEAVESCLHVDRVCSIDEMYGRLLANERDPEQAAAIAHAVKAAIAEAAGPWVRCSVGLGPNAWLAKLATDLQKPDGLVMLRPEQLPERIADLALTDLPGIARGMSRRLERHGVKTVTDLYQQTEAALRTISGSRVWAHQWYSQLRGEDLPYRPTRRQTVGHSHVLPPHCRTHADAFAVMVRMIHKAGTRLRRLGYWADRLTATVGFIGGGAWERTAGLGLTRCTLTMIEAFTQLWSERPTGTPMKVAVVLHQLTADAVAASPLFERERRLNALADTMDRIEARHGVHSVFSGAMLGYESTAPVRISYTQIPDVTDFRNT